jgi:predicted nucleotidyltransferase
MNMASPVEKHRDALAALCRQHGVARLCLFGSAATEHFDPATSDLDFIVAFADKSSGYADRYLDFAEALEELFGREVDVVTERSVQNPYFRRSVESTQRLVYEREDKEAPA